VCCVLLNSALLLLLLLQVAVFDDAEPDPTAALLGFVSVPLAPLAEGVPVQGAYPLTHPASGSPAGTVWVNVAWHDPLAAAALGSRLRTRRVPAVAAGTAAAADGGGVQCDRLTAPQPGAGAAAVGGGGGDPAVEAMQAQLQQLQLQLQMHQQQHQQQVGWPEVMQAPQLLPSVPMLLCNPQQQQQAMQPHMPGVSPAAAAAVAAALGPAGQHVPLLTNATPPGDPTSPFRGQGCGYAGNNNSSSMFLQHGPPAVQAAQYSGGGCFNMRYGAASPVQQPLEQQQYQQQWQQQQSHLQPAAASQARQPALQQPAVLGQPPPLLQQQQPQQQQHQSVGGAEVLRRVGTNAETWADVDTSIYFRVEGLSLSDDALGDPAVRGRHVLLAHMLLEDFTSPVQQCTETALADG
jgi:hypothetical protein